MGVGLLIDACIKYGQNFFKHAIRSPSDAIGLTCENQLIYLLNHDESGGIWVVHNGHMEGEAPICVGEGTDDSETCMLLNRVLLTTARPASLLLMAGLRVESDCNEVAFLGIYVVIYQSSLPTGFPQSTSLVLIFGIRDTSSCRLCLPRTRLTGAMTITPSLVDTSTGSPTEMRASSRICLAKTEPLTVTPFLNFSNHVHISIGYTRYSPRPASCQVHPRSNNRNQRRRSVSARMNQLRNLLLMSRFKTFSFLWFKFNGL